MIIYFITINIIFIITIIVTVALLLSLLLLLVLPKLFIPFYFILLLFLSACVMCTCPHVLSFIFLASILLTNCFFSLSFISLSLSSFSFYSYQLIEEKFGEWIRAVWLARFSFVISFELLTSSFIDIKWHHLIMMPRKQRMYPFLEVSSKRLSDSIFFVKYARENTLLVIVRKCVYLLLLSLL